MIKKGVTTFIVFITCAFYEVESQSLDSSSYTLTVEEDILGLELKSDQEENESVYVLSKEHQDIAKSAISYTRITDDDIVQSGATTLLEVLRLFPDFLVRESTNGNYTLRLRGSAFTNEGPSERNTILLMVDEVPFYNFMEQSVWWEALPVDLPDIKQIEVVRFPHGAWYGPEAAEGIINIVTKSHNGVGLKTQANARIGLNTNYAYQGSISFYQGGRFRARLAGFHKQFTRFQRTSYVFSQNDYVNGDSLLFYQINARVTNPDISSARQSSGAHFSADYAWRKDVQLHIGAGTQNSEAQGIFRRIEEIALSNRLANTNWVSLRTDWKPLRFYASYQSGSTVYSGYDQLQWDYNTQWSGRVEYAKKWEKYRIGLGGGALHYEYTNRVVDTTAENGSNTLPSFFRSAQRYSANVSQQIYLSEDRLIFTLANRLDYYTDTQKLLLNHQLSALFTPFPAHQLSVAVALSERPPNIFDYTSTAAETFILTFQKNLAYEAKYQYQISKNIRANFTYFQYNNQQKINDGTEAKRSGFSGRLDWQINRLLLSGNLTSVRYKEGNNTLVTSPLPELSGSLTARYSAFFNKLQAFLTVNYYSEHTYTSPGRTWIIPSRIHLSSKLSYQIWEEHSLFISGQNLLNSQEVEYPFGDQSQGMYWLGINLRF